VPGFKCDAVVVSVWKIVMSLFEFLMILLSIIVGLGLAEILTGIARIFRERRQVEFS